MEIKGYGKMMLEELTSTIVNGDMLELQKLIKNILESPYFIREQIFWQNFIEYLDNACADEKELRKLSSIIAENGNSSENAKRIIKIIDDVGTKKKAVYIANLTRACCMKNISLGQFFKLSQCVTKLLDEDLDFLKNSIEEGTMLKRDEEYIDDFRSCGLLDERAGGFIYTKRAYDLKKYSLEYENETKNISI